MCRFAFVLLLFASLPTLSDASDPDSMECLGQVPCVIDDRAYHVGVPDEWDGVSALPVLLHFHGWGRRGAEVLRNGRIASATKKRGVLLIAPDGQGRTWDFWVSDSADVRFAQAVIKDAARRFPVDRDRIYVSGYSYGSAMAWRFACEAGTGVAALLAVSGSLPQQTTCTTEPVVVRHVHGLKDTVMRFPMGPGGDRTHAVALWRDVKDCGRPVGSPATWSQRPFLQLERHVWPCDRGQVVLDIHPGGHFIPHGWIARQLDELLGLPPSYP